MRKNSKAGVVATTPAFFRLGTNSFVRTLGPSVAQLPIVAAIGQKMPAAVAGEVVNVVRGGKCISMKRFLRQPQKFVTTGGKK